MAFSYPPGILDATTTWSTGTFSWALAVPSANPVIYTDGPDLATFFVLAPEFTDTAYARQSLTTPATSFTNTSSLQEVEFGCDAPNFGIMSDSGTAGWLVLFNDTGTDATSNVIQVYPISYFADGVTTCLITLAGGFAFVLPMTCPSNF